ncbi:hypothetical protein [Brachybacterium sp. YJGR34]|uniref:hypothetical protein n=1 Tax=Brachybacterium sp. YJGR34 TaxID=2059911 RepID=UPI000E09F6CF|nr:hypothetical protein [Brachybacterium sp. YJGR34]
MSEHTATPGTAGASLPDTDTTRWLAGAATAALLTAVALPMRRLGRDQTEVRDSFPFSHYPMFSGKRGSHYWVTHLLGLTADGAARPLHYSYLGTGGLNAVRRQLRRRVRAGEGQHLADLAAERIASRDRSADRDIVTVQVLRGRYLVDPYMLGADPQEYTSRLDVRGTAAVPGREQGVR